MDIDRFELPFVPKPPRVRAGQVLHCAVHGRRRVVGFSDGPISWPLVRPVQGGRSVPALCGELVEAVRRGSKQSIIHWFGVSDQTVWRWRIALKVPEHNEGTLRLRRGYVARTLHTRSAQRKAAAAARNPARRRRTAEKLRGRPRPLSVIAKMRAAMLGRVLSVEWCRRIARAKRRIAKSYRSAGRPWTDREDRLLRELGPIRASRRIPRTARAILQRWRMLVIVRPAGPRPARGKG